ncbi:MAG TPA: DUF1638 domain-containing protein [Candidatus Fimivivens faecavium]|nr:DUF1638 domain-containing protein [Candidatus Fimivivens faecavium]
MKFRLIGCSSLSRELYHLSSLSPHYITVDLLDPAELLRGDLQQKVDRCDEMGFDAILIAAGLCGVEGLTAGKTPVVIAPAHSCMALLLGSNDRYRDLFSEAGDEPRFVRDPDHAPCPLLDRKCGTPCLVQSPLGLPLYRLAPAGTMQYAADLSYLQALVSGNWDGRFLVLKEGEAARPSYANTILEAARE